MPFPCLFARGLFENVWNFRNLGIVFCCEAEGANKIEKLTWDRAISPGACQLLREQGGGVRGAEGRESSPLRWLLPMPGSGGAIATELGLCCRWLWVIPNFYGTRT